MGTQRMPVEALFAAARTGVARIGRRGDRAVEPLAHGSELPVLGFFQPRHQAAQPRSRTGRQRVVQMAARLAPEPGIERGLGQRQVAFARRRVLCRESLDGLDPRKRRFATVDFSTDLRKIGMGGSAPSAFDGLRRATGPTLAEQQSGMVDGWCGEVFGQRLRLGRQSGCPTLVAIG